MNSTPPLLRCQPCGSIRTRGGKSHVGKYRMLSKVSKNEVGWKPKGITVRIWILFSIPPAHHARPTRRRGFSNIILFCLVITGAQTQCGRAQGAISHEKRVKVWPLSRPLVFFLLPREISKSVVFSSSWARSTKQAN